MKLKTLILLSALFVFTTLSAQDQNISNGSVFDGEPFLAINPDNSQHMVVAWMGWKWLQRIVIKTKVSYNAGETWSEAVALAHVNNTFTSADPSLAFDHQGNVFLTYVDYNKIIDSGGVYIRKSINGGMDWENAVQIIDMHSDAGKKAIDRPWIRIDRSSGPTQGNIYVTTMNAKGATSPYNPYLSRSTNEGQNWDAWRYIDSTGWLAGYFIPQPMPTADVSADGILHCIYPSWVLSQNLLPLFVHASLDNESGNFIYHIVYESADNVADSLSKKGYLLRANPSNEEHLAFIFLSQPDGDADVFLTESFNSGENWTAPIRVNDDPIGNGRMQDLLWADFDEDGDLVVSWRDRRNASDSGYITPSEIWGATLWKDSIAFSANFRISDTLVAYDSILAQSGNDFMCIVLQSDTLNAVWGDTRDSSLNIWMKRIKLPGATSVGISLIASESIPLVDIYPNPFSNFTTIEYTLSNAATVQISIFNHLGEQIDFIQQKQSPGKQQVVWEAKGLPSGMYYFTIETQKETLKGKMLIVK